MQQTDGVFRRFVTVVMYCPGSKNSSSHMRRYPEEISSLPQPGHEDVVRILRESEAEIVVNYPPVEFVRRETSPTISTDDPIVLGRP